LLEGLCGLICGDGALLVPGWCLVILIMCSLEQISTMVKLFPLMKPQILENFALILAFMISTIPDVTLVYRTPMYILCRRLKFLKWPLKEINKLYFNHISKRVSRLETELELLQFAFQQDRDNHLLLEQDRLLHLKLSNLKSAEKMFFSQKIKCKFLKKTDKGSSFFHALMSQNHRRNFIPVIMCSHGRLITSLKEIGAKFM
jgi:hypothetical protein